MPNRFKKLRYVFVLYWVLLAYILAALVWWFIALNEQNRQMTEFKIRDLKPWDKNYYYQVNEIKSNEQRKKAQYIGEGSIFFLLIMAGAVFVFRAVRRQLKQG